jgi:hypothetical protein
MALDGDDLWKLPLVMRKTKLARLMGRWPMAFSYPILSKVDRAGAVPD